MRRKIRRLLSWLIPVHFLSKYEQILCSVGMCLLLAGSVVWIQDGK